MNNHKKLKKKKTFIVRIKQSRKNPSIICYYFKGAIKQETKN